MDTMHPITGVARHMFLSAMEMPLRQSFKNFSITAGIVWNYWAGALAHLGVA